MKMDEFEGNNIGYFPSEKDYNIILIMLIILWLHVYVVSSNMSVLS